MKRKNLLSSTILIAFLVPLTVFGQSSWSENDDMYFSKKDRAKIYASVQPIEHSTTEQSEYAANHNFNSPTIQSTTAGSPTVQTVANADAYADNNQYFIKDFSIKNKADNEVKTYSGINSNTGFQSGINMALSFGPSFGSPFYGSSYNPFSDPFSPYYDPFYTYGSANYYSPLRINPWRYSNDYDNALYYSYYGYYASCLPNTYLDHGKNADRHINGRKVIRGTRNVRVRASARPSVPDSDKAIKSTGSNINPNGRNASRTSRSSYRKYPKSVQNRVADEVSSRPKRINTYSRTNSNSNSSNWNNSSNFNRSNSYKNSGSSSGSRSSSYSRPRVGSPSGSGSRSSSGSRGGGKRNQ